MGLFDFFKNRRDRESAVHVPEPSEQLATSGEAQPVVGQQVPGRGFDFNSVNVQGMSEGDAKELAASLGPMIQKAISEGHVSVEQGPSQTIDIRGSGLREEIMGIMKQHGIDPEAGTASHNIDAGAYGNMQAEILSALAKHGIDPSASGSSILQPDPPKDD